ncbi:MAG TPA: hypothetical protein VFE98_01815 [Candidatus Bathyarchaeia archaeon]|nr:hypothetical protein [Candidatus Bathyarchaeia archaeon]
MPRAQTVDLSSIADRVHPQTWSLFQQLRTRMRQLKGVTMKLDYEKQSREAVPAFYYGSRRLFHLRARGEEINATFHADYKAKNRLAGNQTLDWRLRDQVSKRSWTDFSLRSSKDLAPFVELVRAKYDMINEDVTGKLVEERPIAV